MDHTNLVIVKAGCRDVGRELLNAMSIYAYGLELGVPVADHPVAGRGYLVKVANALYGRYIRKVHPAQVLDAWREFVFLPPTKPAPARKGGALYFFGWLFRNPAGLAAYRAELLEHFGPAEHERQLAQNTLAGLKDKTLIGVHLHQTPYPGFPEGEFLLPLARARGIIAEYLQKNALTAKEAALVIVSDTQVSAGSFDGFTIAQSVGDSKANLHLLSECSVVLGDNSIYSNVAAWFGNIPHVVMTEESMDWEYYAGRTEYFDNTYATFAL